MPREEQEEAVKSPHRFITTSPPPPPPLPPPPSPSISLSIAFLGAPHAQFASVSTFSSCRAVIPSSPPASLPQHTPSSLTVVLLVEIAPPSDE
eukprot:746968-Hanusia_phi.AAC.1